MRIRKHARITNSSLSGGSLFKSHLICQLNQSPWDIITFPPPPPSHSSPLPPPPPPPPYQFDGNESDNGNGSLPNSVAAIESVDSMKLAVKVEETDCKVVKREEKRREAQKSHTMSNRQLAQMKNYDTLAHPSISKSAASNKPTRAQKATSIAPSDRNEFYYYSGFGPRWGKKRDAGTSITHKRERGAVEPVKTVAVPHYSSSEIDDDDEEEEDEDENNRGNRKTTRRKPIKARSLKDLCEVMG